jgi:hypothetical protein
MTTTKLGFLTVMLLLVAYAAKPVSALCGPYMQSCGCVCIGGGDTNDYEGSGSSCTQASSSARSQGYAEADASCFPDGLCSRTYNVVTPCYWDSTAQVYKEVGYVHYRCSVCE